LTGESVAVEGQASQNEATLAQLKSALEQAKANLTLAQVTWDRDRPLVKEGWTTQQQGTVDVQTLKAQDAAVSVAQSNVAAQENLLRVPQGEGDPRSRHAGGSGRRRQGQATGSSSSRR
jgi:multidrug resistance efflux pump